MNALSAILTMIDAIHKKFSGVENLWQKLAQIEFYFLPIKDMGLIDEIHKIDTTWTDMLWKIAVRNTDFFVDNYFLNYFRFLCDLEIYKGNGIPEKDRDFLVLLDEYTYKFFSDRVLVGEKSEKVFQHAAGKFVVYFQMRADGNFFADCLKSYDGKISKFLMLFAFLVYLRNKQTVDDSDFRRRIRVVNNLISNSEDEIREQTMKKLLAQLHWTEQNPELAKSLFECDYDLIDCALLVRFDYFQNKKNIYQFGSKNPRSWQNLFHRSKFNERFEDTQLALDTLLSEREKFSNGYLKKIIDEHLETCKRYHKFEWSYYYIKYSAFRPARYGKYFWNNFEDAPYLFTVYWTEQRWSENAYQPFWRAIVDEETFQNHYNPILERLEFYKYLIECKNDSYVVKNQRNGVDTEDRIQKFKDWYKISRRNLN